jgi:Zn-finger nucleic acid-binding protein
MRCVFETIDLLKQKNQTGPKTCPHCQTSMRPFDPEPNFEIDQCPNCRGIWLENGELARYCGTQSDLPTDEMIASGRQLDRICTACQPETPMNTLRFHPRFPIEIDRCQKCFGIFLDFQELPKIKSAWTALASENLRPITSESPHLHHTRFPFDSPLINRWSLPLALGFGLVLQVSSFAQMLIHSFVLMNFHELGHSCALWLSSIFNIPLSVFVPLAGETRSIGSSSGLIYSLIAILIGLWIRKSVRAGLRWATGLGVLVFILSTYLTWIASEPTRNFWITFGGPAGELILSTLVMMAFYHPILDRLRWDFFRFPALLFAALTLTQSTLFWIKVKSGALALPLGTFLGGPDDTNNDFNRLITEHGWSLQALPNRFLNLAIFCWIGVGVYYLINLVRKGHAARH